VHGLGAVRLAQGEIAAAIPLLEQALALREHRELDKTLMADTRFLLARALWQRRNERRRARALATAAQVTYASRSASKQQSEVVAWLSTHKDPSAR
jgi:hypothetical protein